MRIDPLHYVEWVVWAGSTFTHLTDSERDRFFQDLLGVFQTMTETFSDLPKGKGLGLLLAVAGWLKAHPDPLAPLRVAMEGMRKRWSQHAEGAPA